MKIISTNIGHPKKVFWKNKEVVTGIFKEPVDYPISLETTDVKGDHVIDRRYHGGEEKACYLYSVLHYSFWKDQYPNLNWQYGMFGENLTVDNLDETKINIGDIYRVGTAVVQVSQPRQPCFKLGIKFEDQGILKTFIAHPYSGIYVRILTPGTVKNSDKLELLKEDENQLSVSQVFALLYHRSQDEHLKQKVMNDQYLPNDLKNYLMDKFE